MITLAGIRNALWCVLAFAIVACAGSGANGTPFLIRKTIIAMKAMRLFPSTKA